MTNASKFIADNKKEYCKLIDIILSDFDLPNDVKDKIKKECIVPHTIEKAVEKIKKYEKFSKLNFKNNNNIKNGGRRKLTKRKRKQKKRKTRKRQGGNSFTDSIMGTIGVLLFTIAFGAVVYAVEEVVRRTASSLSSNNQQLPPGRTSSEESQRRDWQQRSVETTPNYIMSADDFLPTNTSASSARDSRR